MPVAFITGAAQGIGYGIALRLAEDGFDIAANDIPSKDLSSVLEAVKDKGRKAIPAPTDVTSADEVEAAVQKAVSELGGVDVMVANAGIAILGPFLESTPEQFDRIVAVNARGVYNCYKSAAKQMIKQGRGGRLIAASSEAGKRGLAGTSTYCFTKFGVRGLTQSVAVELGQYGITANCYCPGFIITPMTAGHESAMVAHVSKLPVSRTGQPEDVANVVSFLASKHSSYITGQSLSVDGGGVMS